MKGRWKALDGETEWFRAFRETATTALIHERMLNPETYESFKSVAGVFTQKVCWTRGQYFAVGSQGKSSI